MKSAMPIRPPTTAPAIAPFEMAELVMAEWMVVGFVGSGMGKFE